MSNGIRNVVIVAAGRSPFHMANPRERSPLRKIYSQQLLGQTIRGVVKNSGISTDDIEQAIVGCGTQAGQNHTNVGKRGIQEALGPNGNHIFARTVNSSCASSMDAAILAAKSIKSKDDDFVIVGGIDAQGDGQAPAGCDARYATNDPKGFLINITKMVVAGVKFGKDAVRMGDYIFGQTTPPDYSFIQMPVSADYIAERMGFTVDELNEYAALSFARATKAVADNIVFKNELIPINMGRGGWVRKDLIRKNSTKTAIANLPPIIKGGFHNAATMSQFGIGASALVLGDEEATLERGVTPLARVVDYVEGGVDPFIGQLLGPVKAVERLLAKRKLKVEDIDLWEVNEASAAVVLAVKKHFDIPIDKLNIHGGAMPFTHPFGASGGRILTHATHELQRQAELTLPGRRKPRYAIATLCVAQGLYAAVLIERWDPEYGHGSGHKKKAA